MLSGALTILVQMIFLDLILYGEMCSIAIKLDHFMS